MLLNLISSLVLGLLLWDICVSCSFSIICIIIGITQACYFISVLLDHTVVGFKYCHIIACQLSRTAQSFLPFYFDRAQVESFKDQVLEQDRVEDKDQVKNKGPVKDKDQVLQY